MELDLISLFKKAFPMLENIVSNYSTHGRNELIIWFESGHGLIFTVDNNRCILEPYMFEMEL